jgi:hypothetical protein
MDGEIAESRPAVVISDIDGSLANIDHRVHLAQAGDWESFHYFAKDDKVCEGARSMLTLFAKYGYEIVIITGRPLKWKGETELWLRLHGIPYDELHMRPSTSYDPDDVLKQQIWQANLTDREIIFAIEDRDKTVEMWRDLGIDVWQISKGKY